MTAVAMTILVSGAFGAVLVSLSDLRTETEAHVAHDEMLFLPDEARALITDTEMALRGYMVTRDPSFLATVEDRQRKLEPVLRKMQAAFSREPALTPIEADIRRLSRQYRRSHALPLAALLKRDAVSKAESVRFAAMGDQRLSELRRLFTELYVVDARVAAARLGRAREASEEAADASLYGLIFSLLALLGSTLLLHRLVVRPLNELRHAADRMGSHDLTARVPDARIRDIQELGSAFNAMAAALQDGANELFDANARLERRVLQRTRDLQGARVELLKRLALAAEFRDDETHEHTERVGRSAGRIARAMGLNAEVVALLELAAPLHDVGKIGIPDEILLKPARLTEEEYEAIKSHTRMGADLLAESNSPVLQMGEAIALNHHERWDGTGYPRGLAGEDIPLVGRIVAVADVFDALTHARQYKEPWPVDLAVDEIRSESGHHFDPAVVEAFLSLDAGELLAPVAMLSA
jgi:HD-GYP domain-containing protein (c-di-GMP phosphodiesterase class II)/CHASE3 domain sensor protein